MGRGIAYPYQHFMLFEEPVFYMYPCDDDGEPDMDAEGEWDEDLFKDFKLECAKALKADVLRKDEWLERESYIFAESDRLKVGIDSSGGSPCLFVIPRTYNLFGDYYNEREYKIDRDVARGFNALIDSYGKNKLGQSTMFRYPSSAWTSYGLAGYHRELLKRKGKTA